MPDLSAPRRKWRPPLALVIAGVAALLIALPIFALVGARLTSNQFVRETESSLLAQSAILAETYAAAFEAAAPDLVVGKVITGDVRALRAGTYYPVTPRLRPSSDDILGTRPEGQPSPRPIVAPYDVIGPGMSELARRAQKSTLAGYLFLDAFGRSIGGSGGIGYSYAHVPEVQSALTGEVTSVLRARSDTITPHPLRSISRDTNYRVHVAHPVIVGERVVGVVYVSRTPLDLSKFLYQERGTLLRVTLVMVLGAAAVGFLLWRFISGPIGGLREQSQAVAAGERALPQPLAHYGVRELADLGASVIRMGKSLRDRSEAMETYTAHVTHELKSPVTSIVGAAELLTGAGERMGAERRAKLVSNIHAEGLRMNALLGRLRELARARSPGGEAAVPLSEIVAAAQSDGLEIALKLEGADAELPLSRDQGVILLTQMAQNAAEHGAQALTLVFDAEAGILRISDDGRGISEANLTRVTDPFFTTRRDGGGTGMGLAIVGAVVEQAGGVLRAMPQETGALFEIQFPAKE